MAAGFEEWKERKAGGGIGMEVSFRSRVVFGIGLVER